MNLSLLSFLALALPTMSAPTAADKLKSVCPLGSDGFIVVGKAGVDVGTVAARHNVVTKRAYKSFPGFSTGELTNEQVAALHADSDVKTIEANCKIQLEVQASASELRSWGLEFVGARDSSGTHLLPANGAGANSYVVDTGIQPTHEDLPGSEIAFDSFGESGIDGNGHGTHCAGTVGGATSGVSPGTKLYGVRVLNNGGSGTWEGVIAGMDFVTEDGVGPRLMSMSLGGGNNAAVCSAVAAAEAAGVPVIAAAGNGNSDACFSTPADCATITVGSTNEADAFSTFSNFGTCVDILAPGELITSSWIGADNAYNTISGTSMACPHVAGVMAAVLQAYGTIEIDALKAYIIDYTQADRITGVPSATPNLFLRADLVPYATSEPTISAAPTVSAAPTASPTTAPTYSCEDPCNGETCLALNLLIDNFGGETSWTLSETDGPLIGEGSGYGSATQYQEILGVTPSMEGDMKYTYQIFDAYGDGICCSYGEGYYALVANDPAYTVIPAVSGGEFGSEETKIFDVVGSGSRRKPLFGGPDC